MARVPHLASAYISSHANWQLIVYGACRGMQRFFRQLRRVVQPGWVPPGRDDPGAFRQFLGSRAAFVAQKTVMDYCGVKLGVNWQKAQGEPGFAAALGACRWAVFYPAAADLTLAAARWLLPHAQPMPLAAAMARLGEAALREAGAAGGPEALENAALALRARLLALPDEPPVGPATMALAAAQPLLDTLPIHPDQRKGERVAILGGLRMNLVAMCQDMERAFDPAPLAARIVRG
jgi:hypothetical protein